MATSTTPNHHAGHQPFTGPLGYAVGLTFLVGRSQDARLACDLAGVGSGDRVLDIGCGPGVAVREAVRRGASAVGVDPADPMLRLARLRRTPGAEFRPGTAEALPVEDGSVSVAWSLATAHHWTDVALGLGEAFRALGPAGRLLVIERRSTPGATGHAGHGWTPEQADAFAEAVGRAGFVEVGIQTRPGRHGDVLAVLAHKPS
jgi:ubiquinone/menaquinone biosynthesis C-methylase UbiE